MIIVTCSCGTKLKVEDSFAGKQVRCPSCQAIVVAPALGESSEGLQAGKPPPPLPVQPEEFAERSPPRSQDDDREGRRRDRDDDERDGRRRDRDDDDPRSGRGRGRDEDYAGGRYGPQTSGKAIASLVCGIIGLFFPLIPGVIGLIFGFLALSDIKNRRLAGTGLAIAGIIFSVLSCGCNVISVALLVPAVQKVREAAARTQTVNNAKVIGLAFHAHNDARGFLPGPNAPLPDGKPGQLSWRVGLLPYMDAANLHGQFALDLPWDNPRNQPLLNSMPRTYVSPLEQDLAEQSKTPFQVFTGPGTPFPNQNARASIPRTFTDGTSNVILFAQGTNAVPWTKPVDIAVGPNQPLALPERFVAGFADASVRVIDRRMVSEQVLRLLINPSDGQPIPPLD